MRNRIKLLRTEQNRTEKSRSYNYALFVPCVCKALETAYYIRDG